MTKITSLDGVFIAQIAFYTPTFLCAIYLALKHGFGKSSGSYYVILFTLMRLVGAAMYLATISDPTNVALYIGSATLQSAGVSAIILVQVAFLGKCVALATHRNVLATATPVTGGYGSKAEVGGEKKEIANVTAGRLRLIQLLLFVALVTGIAGGANSSESYSDTGILEVSDSSKAALGITLAGYGVLVLASVAVSLRLPGLRSPTGYSDELTTMRPNESSGSPGPPFYDSAALDRMDGKVRRTEARHVIVGILASLPFVLVRLIYSCKFTFDQDWRFSTISGKVGYFFGMSVVMEMVVVLLVEVLGFMLTTRKAEEKALEAATGEKSGWHKNIPLLGLFF